MGLNPKELAPTAARSVPSIVIQATNPSGQTISIGAIKSMDRHMTRDMTRRRELDSDIPGVTVEIIPGIVNTFELSVERAMLYKSSMLQAFGIGGIEDLTQQNIPFEVVEVRNNLDGTQEFVTYNGCYFKDNPLTIDLDREWIIFQKATIEVASCTVTGKPQSGNIQGSISAGVPGVSFSTVAGSQPPTLA